MNFDEIMNYGNSLFVNGLVNFIVSSIGLLIIAFIMKSILSKYLKKIIPAESNSNTGFYIKTITTVIYMIVLFIIFSDIKPLKSLGSAVLGASSLLAVIVGLAAQETLSNFVSGFILSIYQPFKIGDVIIIKEKALSGTVNYIGFRHTIIRTIDNTNIIVPNNVMNTAIIENRKTEVAHYRNSLSFDISYDSDIEKAKEIIKRNTITHPSLIDTRNETQIHNNEEIVKVFCTNLKEFSVELSVVFYTKDFGLGYEMKSDLRQSVLKEFDKSEIGIPYPTRVVKQQ